MRILIADDDRVSRRLLEAALARWGYEVRAAGDGAEAWRVLEEADAPRLAVLDWVMPGRDGVEICRELRKRRKQPYTYILLLTTKARKRDIIEGLEAGADDYLVKPFETDELKARLRAGKRILELQEQLIASQEALRFQATHDALTGLWNRPAILEMLATELARSRRAGAPVGVILADLDHFKQINDTYGHPAGDAVLREAAQRMRRAVRPYDAIGRYGGEEFLIVAPGCDVHGAVSQAERLRNLAGETAVETPQCAVRVTLSLGVAVADPGQAGDVDALLRAADAALYEAKRNGRDRVELGGRREKG